MYATFAVAARRLALLTPLLFRRFAIDAGFALRAARRLARRTAVGAAVVRYHAGLGIAKVFAD
jgi:hypothetical protein